MSHEPSIQNFHEREDLIVERLKSSFIFDDRVPLTEKIIGEIDRFEEVGHRLRSLKINSSSSDRILDEGSEDDTLTLNAVRQQLVTGSVLYQQFGVDLLEYAQLCNLRRHSV